jgi:signal transduction histidine kinase
MVAPWITVPRRIWRLVQLVIAATVLGVAAAAWLHIIASLEGEPPPFLRTVAFVMPFWYLWALYAPLVVWLSARYPIERRRVVSRCSIHLAIAVMMSLVHTGVRFGLQPGIREGTRLDRVGMASWDPLFALAALELPVHVFIYGAILGGTHIFQYYRRLRERQLAATRLSAQLADARMQALRMQLNPHFLFNALNSVAMLVRGARQEAAVDTLEGLSDLLRYVLDSSTDQEVKLKRELEFIERYLTIEQVRFQDRLQVRIDVDSDTLDAMVPTLVLQPIVENAIRHGIASRVAATTVTVAAREDQGALRLRVSDDGPGFSGTAGARRGTGVGISNTRRRLTQLYGDRASIDVEDTSPSGATVTITLPFHTVPLAKREPQ